MRALAAAALCAAACRRAAPPPPEAQQQTFEGLTLSQSDAGAPSWTLHARRAFLHEDQNRADLEAPVMDFYTDGKASSRVVARGGFVDTLTHDVLLSSGVVVDSFQDHSHLTTEALTYSSKTGMMKTDLPVTIRRPDGVVRGRGLLAKPDLSEMRIFNQRSVLSGRDE